MRIAFYSPRASHLDLKLSGGHYPVFLHGLFAALRARGHEIEVVSRLDIRDVWRGCVPLRRLLREAIETRGSVKRFAPDAWLVFRVSRTYADLLGWWQRPRRYVLLFAYTWAVEEASESLEAALRSCVLARPAFGGSSDCRSSGHRRTAPKCRSPDPSRRGRPPRRPAARRGAYTKRRSQASRAHVERAVVDLALDERVRMPGAVENDQMIWFYAACDVYVYPNPLDRPWVSVLEAQACGRPVVTMRTESGELTVVDGEMGLLADDLGQFREHLEALVADGARCESMGRVARRFIAERHSSEAFALQVEGWLQADA